MKVLKEERKKAGYTQGDFAKKLGIAQSTYCQYETGKRAVSEEMTSQICKLLGVTKEDIFLPKSFTVSK